jgi:hypothetical protein
MRRGDAGGDRKTVGFGASPIHGPGWGNAWTSLSGTFVQARSRLVLLNAALCPALSGFVQAQNPAGQGGQGACNALSVPVVRNVDVL